MPLFFSHKLIAIIVGIIAGLLRCGKSCRLRWTNYLRPDLKRGLLSDFEEQMVIDLHAQLGNRFIFLFSLGYEPLLFLYLFCPFPLCLPTGIICNQLVSMLNLGKATKFICGCVGKKMKGRSHFPPPSLKILLLLIVRLKWILSSPFC